MHGETAHVRIILGCFCSGILKKGEMFLIRYLHHAFTSSSDRGKPVFYGITRKSTSRQTLEFGQISINFFVLPDFDHFLERMFFAFKYFLLVFSRCCFSVQGATFCKCELFAKMHSGGATNFQNSRFPKKNSRFQNLIFQKVGIAAILVEFVNSFQIDVDLSITNIFQKKKMDMSVF